MRETSGFKHVWATHATPAPHFDAAAHFDADRHFGADPSFDATEHLDVAPVLILSQHQRSRHYYVLPDKTAFALYADTK